jgi:beta-galactosidase/beta-glucuronidase
MTKSNKFIILVGILMAMVTLDTQAQGPAKVEVRNVNGKYQLYRNGEPYFIKGAGLEIGDMASLASHGANSLRNWAVDNGREPGEVVLDRAQKNGLSVIMGIDIKRERHGFDYNNPDSVKKQLEWVKKDVIRMKDHPALLAWGIGNELNLKFYQYEGLGCRKRNC